MLTKNESFQTCANTQGAGTIPDANNFYRIKSAIPATSRTHAIAAKFLTWELSVSWIRGSLTRIPFPWRSTEALAIPASRRN